MSADQAEKMERGIACPACGCHHLYVVYTRHRAQTIVRVRACRQCHVRVVTHERVAGRCENKFTAGDEFKFKN